MSIKVFKAGFSLIEVALSLVILGMILLNFQGIAKQLFEVDHQQTQQNDMLRINDAMNTFLSVNAFLPCPDTDSPPDGLENREDGTVDSTIKVCTDREGYLPYADLGVKSKDAWGNDYYYRVHQRAESEAYITQACRPASVLGREGTGGITNLSVCPASNQYYCKAETICSAQCKDVDSNPVTCLDTIDPRPNANVAPFFHLATPPFGNVPGEYNVRIYNENAASYDSDADDMDGGVVAVAVSWGANGDSVYRYSDTRNSCVAGTGTAAELANCADSRDFVDIRTGEGRDFITWATVNQAKVAIIGTGEFR